MFTKSTLDQSRGEVENTICSPDYFFIPDARRQMTILPFLDLKISKISSNVWKAAHDDGW